MSKEIVASLIENQRSKLENAQYQEVIKVREWIPLMGIISKVIPLALFLDTVPSFSADVTGTLSA